MSDWMSYTSLNISPSLKKFKKNVSSRHVHPSPLPEGGQHPDLINPGVVVEAEVVGDLYVEKDL